VLSWKLCGIMNIYIYNLAPPSYKLVYNPINCSNKYHKP
jgi:hypothetical protein